MTEKALERLDDMIESHSLRNTLGLLTVSKNLETLVSAWEAYSVRAAITSQGKLGEKWTLQHSEPRRPAS